MGEYRENNQIKQKYRTILIFKVLVFKDNMSVYNFHV